MFCEFGLAAEVGYMGQFAFVYLTHLTHMEKPWVNSTYIHY